MREDQTKLSRRVSVVIDEIASGLELCISRVPYQPAYLRGNVAGLQFSFYSNVNCKYCVHVVFASNLSHSRSFLSHSRSFHSFTHFTIELDNVIWFSIYML